MMPALPPRLEEVAKKIASDENNKWEGGEARFKIN
jgi:hypothetical protein